MSTTGLITAKLPASGIIAIGDVNGDGLPDLLTDTGLYYAGLATGGFSAVAGTLALPFTPAGLAFADINKDGKPDLIEATSNGLVDVLVNQGGGTYANFATLALLGAITGIAGIATGDFNGTGTQDIAVATATTFIDTNTHISHTTSAVDLLIQSGSAFTETTQLGVGGIINQMIVADVNDDGHPDLLVATTQGLDVFVNNGTGSFNPAATIYLAGTDVTSLAVGDLNGDNFADVVVGVSAYLAGQPMIDVLINNGTAGGFAAAVGYLPVPATPATTDYGAGTGVAIADVAGTGHPDVLATTTVTNGNTGTLATENVTLLSNAGSGALTTAGSVATTATTLLPGMLSKTGGVAVVNGTIAVYDGTIFNSVASALAQAGTITGPFAIIDSAANVAANLNALQPYAAADRLVSITLTDSGTPNLAIGASQASADAGVLAAIQGGFTAVPTSSAFDDFTGNGMSDVLWQSTDGTVVIWEMSGTTITGGGEVADAGPSWHVDGSGDFDTTGTSDLLLQASDGSIAVWMMNGTTITAGAVVANPGTTWHVEGSGNFSGAGPAAILLQGDDGTIAEWTVNGDTLVGGAIVADPGPAWHVVGTGDFNGTGTTDIVLQAADGSVAIWDMNGSTIASSMIVAQPGPTWQVVATGDFNNDGKSDIVVQNQDGAVGVWQMNGGTIAAAAIVADPGSGWHVVGTGNYGNAADAGILLQDNSGDAAVWQMNGTSLASAALIGSVPANWQTIGQGTTNFINGNANAGTLAATPLNDEFIFTAASSGAHAIAGFDPFNDMIQLSAAQFGSYAGVMADTSNVGGAAVIALGGGATLTLQGVLSSQLSSRNFLLG